jgi:hypothetical protein
MHRGKSTARREHMITVRSSNNDDDNVSLGANQEEASMSTHDAASSSAIPQHRGGVPSQQDPLTCKYKAYWKDDLSM